MLCRCLCFCLFFPLGQESFVDPLFVERTVDADEAVDRFGREFTHFFSRVDTDRLRVVAAHQENFASAVLADMRADAFDNDGLTDERFGVFQQAVYFEDGTVCGRVGGWGALTLFRCAGAATDGCAAYDRQQRYGGHVVSFHGICFIGFEIIGLRG